MAPRNPRLAKICADYLALFQAGAIEHAQLALGIQIKAPLVMRPFFSAVIKASCTWGLVNAENEAYSPTSAVMISSAQASSQQMRCLSMA